MSQSDKGSLSGVSFHTVDAQQAGQRVDNFLLSRLKGVPKSRIYRIVRKGEVRVNRGRVKPDYKLQAGDEVRVPPIRLASREAPAQVSDSLKRCLEEAVLYEDQDVIVLNKPAGLAVHAGTGVELGLIEALRQCRDDERLELVHRLDKATSGCLLVSRHLESLNALTAAFRNRQVDKRYHALVSGQWPASLNLVDQPLLRQEPRNGERKVSVDDEGKSALTRFQVLERFRHYTLIEASPETGRTHQIRVHCQVAGHPLAGDDKYQRPESLARARQQGIRRLCLHAASLTLTLPSGVPLHVEAPYDESFSVILRACRQTDSGG